MRLKLIGSLRAEEEVDAILEARKVDSLLFVQAMDVVDDDDVAAKDHGCLNSFADERLMDCRVTD